MRNIIFITASILLITAAACKKDKTEPAKVAYENIDRAFIMNNEAKMTAEPLLVVDKGDVIKLKPGAVVLFKTNLGNFGKLKIDMVQVPLLYALKIEATVYNADDSVLIPNTEALLANGDGVNLDTFSRIFNDMSDFLWASPEEDGLYSITPLNGAKFYVYAKK